MGTSDRPSHQLWRGALLVALAYLVGTALYFAFADRVLGSPDDPLRFHVAKGWAFIALSAMALFVLVWRANLRLWRRAQSAAREAKAERQEQARKLDEVNQQLRLLHAGTPSFFFYVRDAARRVTYVSPTVEHILGRSADHWLGTTRSFTVGAELAGPLGDQPTVVETSHVDGRSVVLEIHEHGRFEQGRLASVQGIALDVTERATAERAVAQSERRYRTLAEAGRDFIFIVGSGGCLEFVNGVAAAAVGERPAAMIGQRLERYFPIEAVQRMLANLGQVSERGEPLNVEDALEIGGQEVWLNTSLVPILDEDGQVLSVLGVSRDVSERRRAELVQAAVHKISREAISARSLDELYRGIHAIVSELMPAENLYIALHDRDRDELSFAYWVDEKDPCPESRTGGRGLTEYVVRTGRPLLTSPAVFEQLRDTGEVDTLGSLSLDWLGVPLRFQDRVIGVLAVQTYAENLRYGDREKQILEFVSTQIAFAIEWTRAEQALRESEERYRRLVELSPDGIAIHARGRLTFVNRQGMHLLGIRSAEEALGLPVLGFVHPEDRAKVEERVRRGMELREPQPPMEERFVHADGTIVHVEVAATPFLYLGEQATLVVFRDIGERLRVAEQLRQAQKMEAVGQLAGGVAHDFNNLLQAMLAAIQVLRSGPDDSPRRARTLGELEAHVGRGASMTRQLLLFSRRDVARRGPLDLEAVVVGTAEMLRRLVPERVRTQLELHGNPLPVEADRGQIEQVLVNLVLNACDAMAEGGELVLRTGERPGQVWLEVADTGAGVPDSVRPRIFEPFFTTKPPTKGSGLGLAVVHGIVAGHGGEIEISTQAGRGSVFRVVLPRLERQVAAGEEGVPAASLRRGDGERVLLVEDEPATRDGLTEVLGMLGYQMTAVGSGEEALALASEPEYEVLLTDLALPGIDGTELGQTLQARWPGLEVVVMSGYAADHEVRRKVGEGRLRYLQKPFTMETLTQELGSVLDRRKGAR